MALEIFKLVGSIFVNNEEANKSIAKTDEKAEGLGTKLLKGVGTAAKWGGAIVTAAGAGASALTGIAMKVSETAGDIDDAAKRAGTSAEEYQKWAYAAKMGGMEASALEKAMVKQQKAFADAKEGSKALGEAYSRLGIDINSIEDSGQAFDEVMAKLADMEDVTQRNAIANDIFGKSYAELAPLLAEGSDGIERLKQEAVDLGAVMSNESVDAGAQLGDTIDKLKASFGGIANSLGASVMPIIQKLADMILSYMPSIQEMMGALFPIITDAMDLIMPCLMDLAEQILPVVFELMSTLLPVLMELASAILPIFTELIQLLLPPLLEIVQAVLPVLVTIIEALTPILQLLIELLTPIIQLFVDLLGPIIKVIAEAITPLIEIVGLLISTALEPLSKVISAVAEIFGGALKGMFDAAKPIIDKIIGVFSGITTFLSGIFSGDFKKAFQGISDIVKNIFGGIVEVVKFPINAIIGLINGFIGGLNKIKIPDWVPGVGGKGINIPQIPKLERGGILEKGQIGLLEGNGAEAVVPLDQNRKWISRVAQEMSMQGCGIDYDRLSHAVVDAIREVIPELKNAQRIEVDESGIFRVVRDQAREYKKKTGDLAFT